MIAIVNTEPFEINKRKEIFYELKINNKPLCRFKHKRSEGLIVCLEKAVEKLKSLESSSK